MPQARFFQIDDKIDNPEAAVPRDSVETVTDRGSTVELFSDPGHGDQRNGGGDYVELQVAQPGQILQIGIAQEVDCHKSDDDLVHRSLLMFVAYPFDRRVTGFCNGRLSEVETASQLVGDMERVLGRSRSGYPHRRNVSGMLGWRGARAGAASRSG
jgi:hypothetical protein